MEKFKDFLYSFMDYFFIIIIVILVAGVIAWRLNLLFNKNYAKKGEDIVVEDNIDEDDNIKEDEAINTEDGNDDEVKPEDENVTSEDIKTITIEIPKGAVSTTIGDILAEQGLVHDSKSFVDKATELGKETKLKSGTYEIPNNLSLEGVIEILTK